MEGICDLCKELKELTNHHIAAKKYQGYNDLENLKPNICRKCHTELENRMKEMRGKLGADKNYQPPNTVTVGETDSKVQAGSRFLDRNGQCIIDSNSPIYGASFHNKISGERTIEVIISGGSLAFITGSPWNSYIVYTIISY